jgi:hypothetical protein
MKERFSNSLKFILLYRMPKKSTCDIVSYFAILGTDTHTHTHTHTYKHICVYVMFV